MQHLRGTGWVKATGLPDSTRIISNLIKKGWVECQHTEGGQAYRLTELGLQARCRSKHGTRSGRSRPPPGRGEAIMIGLSPVRTVTVTIDGVLYEGTYFVQQQMIHVRSQFGAKATKVGGSMPEALAKLLLSEMVRAGSSTD